MKRILGTFLFAGALLGACGPDFELPNVPFVEAARTPLFLNGGFEQDAGSLASWTVTSYRNDNGLTVVPPASFADLNLLTGGSNFTFTRTNAVPESQLFSGMLAGADVPKWPKIDTTSVVVNEQQGVTSTNTNSLKQAYTVLDEDVDPSDGKVHVRFVLAPALQAAGHVPARQPYFFVSLRNVTTNAMLYTNFNYANSPGVPWKSQGTGATAVLYTDWVIFDIAPGNAALKVGDSIEVEVIAARCQPNGHFGEVYVDGFGAKFPGLSISKTAVQSTNIDSNVTYDFVVQNNTPGLAPGVVAKETLPFGTTFVSASTSAPGASCSGPAVGATGVVTCTFGQMNPGATATFRVVVRAFAPAPNGTGTASAATTTTLSDATQTWTANAFAGWTVYLVGGQGVGQYRTIVSNTATQLTVTPAFTTTPNTTTQYKIIDPPQETGTSTGATNNTVTDTTKTWTTNQWVASTVTVLSGAGAGQTRLVTTSTTDTLTVSPNWTTQPGAGARFAIGLPPDKLTNGNYTIAADTISSLLGPRVETTLTAGVTYTDLAVTVTDGVPAVNWSSPAQYVITVTNTGPAAVTGASVTDTFPAQLTGVTWTCSGSSGGTCAASGSGNLNQLVNLPVGASVTFVVSATVVAGTGTGSVFNVASVTAPAGVTDSDSRNNSDGDRNAIGPLVALTVNKNPSDSGLGTVTSLPLAIGCDTACSTQSATFAQGTLVTLTAVARPGDTFVGWEGDCTGASLTCAVTLSQARTVTARFRGPLVTGSAGTGGTVTCTPGDVRQGQASTCTVTPDAAYVLSTLKDNGTDVSGAVSNGTYTANNVVSNRTIAATFNRRPDFTSTAPLGALAGTPYVYTPTVVDTDTPGALTYSRAAEDTCGGTVGTTGTYTFTAGAEATCVVAVRACDSATPPACRTQQSTVTVNHPPVAAADMLTARPNGATSVQATTLTANDTAGGASAEQASQTLTVTAVSATSSQGGTVTLVGGVVTYTPAMGFVGTDTFTYTVTDSGSPAGSTTATVTVTVSNTPPSITSTASSTATEGTPYTYTPTVLDPDGPGATWSIDPADTCGGSIDAMTGAYAFTPQGPVPPATCVVAVRVCDGGTPDRCTTQSTTVTVTGVNDAPTFTSTPPATATGGLPYAYTPTVSDPDGPSKTFSVGAGDTCGGAVDASSGAYTVTPGTSAPASCVVALQVCDGGTPNQCVTQTQTVTVSSGNQAPAITSTAPGQATAGTAYTYAATSIDPDGPAATWSIAPTDTCGGSIDASTGAYRFTPVAPPPDTCVVAVRVCDGGTPERCTTQETTVTVARASSTPQFTSLAPTNGRVGVSYDYTPTVTGAGSTPRFFIGAGDTCGGTVDPATGAYQFTPQTSGPCVVAVQACDASQTSACNTQSTTVEVARADGFADGVGLSGGGCGCQSVTDAGSVWGFVVAALGGLRLRRRRG